MKFHEKGTDFYSHGKTLEEYLDKFLEMWIPEYAYESFEKEVITKANRSKSPQPSTSTGKKRKIGEVNPQQEILKEKKKHKKAKKHKKLKKHNNKRSKKEFINDGPSDDEESYDEESSEMSTGEQLDMLDDLESALERRKAKGQFDDELEEDDDKPKKGKKKKNKKK